MIKPSCSTTPEWRISAVFEPYPTALTTMEKRVEDILTHKKHELTWLLEHPPLYTAGSSALPAELLNPGRFPVYQTHRGGRYTYHGPGQRIAYVLNDLRHRGQDIHAHVWRLEEWIIRTLDLLGVQGFRREGRQGIWVITDVTEAKIAAVGVHVRRWVTSHGVALNVNPDLEHFNGIVPCGLEGYGVTSLKALGVSTTMAEIDALLQKTWGSVFT